MVLRGRAGVGAEMHGERPVPGVQRLFFVLVLSPEESAAGLVWLLSRAGWQGD
jgi:hypothetical protein